MKKFAAGLAAAALSLTLGVAGTAHAKDPYPGTVTVVTVTDAPGSAPAGQKVTVDVAVKSPGANPKGGHVRIVITDAKGNIVAIVRAPYKKKVSFTLPKLPPGNYTLTTGYVGKNGSVFMGSRNKQSFKVNKKHKK